MNLNYFLTYLKKKSILKNIIKPYKNYFNIEKICDNLYFDTPGNILKYLKILKEINVNSLVDKSTCISHLIDKYKQKKDPHTLTFISFLIELFYNELSLKNKENLNIYFYNKFKILKQIKDAKKFSLDKNNLFISIQGILKNET